MDTSSKDTNSPWNDSVSSVHARVRTSRYSSVIRPRRSKGSPSASNSWRAQPIPAPNRNRPPLNRSMLAVTRAVCSGWRYGTIATVVPSSIRSVCPASQASVVNGS